MYALVENGNVIREYSNLPKLTEAGSFSSGLTAEQILSQGFYPLVVPTKPDFNIRTEKLDAKVYVIDIEAESVTYTQAIIPQTQQEIDDDFAAKMVILRLKRNELLQDSDHLIGGDFPINESMVKQDIIDYRQTLRDIPENMVTGDYPDDVVFPVLGV